MKVTISFTLNDKEHQDLKRWLDGLPKRGRSEAIRETLRAGLRGTGLTLGDVYQAVKELERKLESGAIVSHTAAPAIEGEEDVPPDVLENLAKLGG